MSGPDLGLGGSALAPPRPTADLLPGQRSTAPDENLPNPRTATDRPAAGVDVLVVDPDGGNREALRAAFADAGLHRVAEAATVEATTALLAAGVTGPLALVSLALGGPESAGLVATLRQAGWVRVIALAPTADIGPVIDAVGNGVHGVLIARGANPAARTVPVSVHELSSREIEVLTLVADGRSNKWIGDQLALSALTVKSHLARIGRKLGTGDRAQMVAIALRAGVLA